MKSRDLRTAAHDEVDARWQGPNGAVLVEFERTHSMRDVRHALLTLAYLLRHEPSSTMAVCMLVDSRLSDSRLRDELQQLRQVIHPEIANRVHYLVDKGHIARTAAATLLRSAGRSPTPLPTSTHGWRRKSPRSACAAMGRNCRRGKASSRPWPNCVCATSRP
jgi:hypothetical protein